MTHPGSWLLGSIALALVALTSMTGSLAATSQCIQPTPDGCPLGVEQTVSASLAGPDDAHLWRLQLTTVIDLSIVLSDLNADYRLYVYGPDLSLVNVSDVGGWADEVVDIPAASAGEYQVFVDSPRGETTPDPYTLRARAAILEGSIPPAPQQVPVIAFAPETGGILLSDQFDNPASGWLPRSSPEPDRYLRGYLGGEYQIQLIDGTWTGVPTAFVPGTYADSSLAVDVRIVGDPGDRSFNLGCRDTAPTIATQTGYRLALDPERRRFRIWRRDSATSTTTLLDWQPSGAIRRGGETNRVELVCVGNTIGAFANGALLASVVDDLYNEGRMYVGFNNGVQLLELRIDNLVVYGR